MTRRLFLPVLAALLLWSGVAGAVSVQMTSPANGAGYTAPANVTVSSLVELWEDGERLGSHRIYQNGAQIASGTRSLSTTVNGLPAGTHTFHSSATNSWGEYVESIPVTITVVVPGGNAPSVTVSASAGSYIAPAAVPLSASAADSDGYITRVEFFANGGLVGTATAAPFAITWSNAPAGNHSVTAKAFDNNGISTTSAAVAVNVAATTITGNIDSVHFDGTDYSVRGWACSTGRNQSIDVHLYAGGPAGSGVGVGAYTANQPSEPAVAAACQGQGTAHRFQIALTPQIRQQHANKKIYIHGISQDGQANLLIASSGTFSIPAPLSLTRRYVYDAHQQLCKTIEPETGSAVMAYDAAGNLNWSASGLSLPDTTNCNHNEAYGSGRRVQRYHNSRNRLTTLNFPDGNGDQNWTYTPDGLPSQIVTFNDGGTTSVVNAYGYNKRRLLTGESVQQPGWYGWGIGYGYDGNGNLATHTYPTGLLVDYAPNALGQATRAGSFAQGVAYYPNGAIQQFTYGNGIVHTMQQNARQFPDRSSDSGAAMDFSYRYDLSGNVTQIYDHIPDLTPGSPPKYRLMDYDGLDRLTGAGSAMFGGDHWHRYTYDALDNMRSWKLGGVKDHNYIYDASNRLSFVRNSAGASSITFEFDVQGNLRTKNNQTYSFDYGNRLRASSQEWYRYDGHGRRVLNWRGNEPGVLSQYSQSGRLVYDENFRASGRKASEHIYLGGSLIATRERNIDTQAWATKYQHTDALGSPVAVTNETGQVIDRTQYEPYGASISKNHDGIGYTGHVMDSATGLTYMQQRYYDPTLGRFLSTDPVQANPNTGASFNRYAYANNNPYKFTDPDGRDGVALYTDPQYKMSGSSVDSTEAANTGLAMGAAAYGGPIGRAIAGGFRTLGSMIRRSGKDGSDKPKVETKARAEPGADGGRSTISREVDPKTGETLSTKHTVEKDGAIVHQHQDHMGKAGSVKTFSDKLTGTKTVGEGKQAPTPKDTPPNFPREPTKGSRY